MTNIGDLYTDFRADEPTERFAAPSGSRDWFVSQSIPRKLLIIHGVHLTLVALIGAFAWYGLARLDTTLGALSSDLGEQVSADIATAKMLIFGAVILAFVVGAFGLRRVRKDISSGVTDLREAMASLSRGRLDVTVTGLDRTDEFGEMARSMEHFRRGAIELRRLQEDEVERATSRVAEQDDALHEQHALREAHRSALIAVADNFDKTIGEIVGGVAAAASELQATATAMAANADQSLRQSERVGEALVEASGGVTAAAAASEEFAISIGEISRQATSSAELARKASGATGDADKTLSELTESAAEVGKVVELISHIAQRTNLLALNASIEAARGGEAGRGFAVVATEVKELATQTGKATQQVAQQIRAMQDTTGASVGALRDIASHIKELEITSVSIAAAVDQQSSAGRDLAKSIDLAARGAEDVTSNIEQVHQASKATGTVAGQVLASATELEKQATFLRLKAGDFISEVRKA